MEDLARDTGWKIFAGAYGPDKKLSVIHEKDPILWRGSEPPLDADAHIYAVFEGPKTFELRLVGYKPDLACGGHPVERPDKFLIFDHTPIYLAIKRKIKTQL